MSAIVKGGRTAEDAFDFALRELDCGNSEPAEKLIQRWMPPFVKGQVARLRSENVRMRAVLTEFVRDIGCYCDLKHEDEQN